MLFVNWNIDPEIVRTGGFALRYYSLGFLFAFASSYWIMKSIFTKDNIPVALLDKLTFAIFIGTLAGARLGHCFFYDWAYYKDHLLEIISPVAIKDGHFELTGFQGLASHGGAVGILIATLLWCRKYMKPPLWLLDRLSLVIPIAAFFVRLGNLFNSEIIGKPSDLPWAFVFERVDNIPRHPAQLYEALSYLLLAGLLHLLFRHNAGRKDGFLFGVFLAGLFGIRFVIEFVKENQEAFENQWLLNMGQLLSIPFVIAGLLLAFNKRKKELAAPTLPAKE